MLWLHPRRMLRLHPSEDAQQVVAAVEIGKQELALLEPTHFDSRVLQFGIKHFSLHRHTAEMDKQACVCEGDEQCQMPLGAGKNQ